MNLYILHKYSNGMHEVLSLCQVKLEFSQFFFVGAFFGMVELLMVFSLDFHVFVLNVMQKSVSLPPKEGSTARPKGTVLERAIRDLEKVVAECEQMPSLNTVTYCSE